jgi:hypothetical protein
VTTATTTTSAFRAPSPRNIQTAGWSHPQTYTPTVIAGSASLNPQDIQPRNPWPARSFMDDQNERISGRYGVYTNPIKPDTLHDFAGALPA